MPDYDTMLNDTYGKDPKEAISKAIEVYKDCKRYAKEVQVRARVIIEDIIIETNQTDWNTENGRVYFPKPSVSIRYDAKALDALCASNPQLKEILWPHRKETERPGSMTIR